MSTPSTLGTKFALYWLDPDNPGSVEQIGYVLGRMVVCETPGCWAKDQEIEVADDGTIVCCGACGKQLEDAGDHGSIVDGP